MKSTSEVLLSTWFASLLALGATACLDPLTEPYPIVRLLGAADAIHVPRGEAESLVVQAVDVNGQPVNGAQITFARADSTRLGFEGSNDDVDAVTVTTAVNESRGLSIAGAAVARLRVLDAAPLGDTSVVAVVKGPTTDPTSAVAIRIAVEIVEGQPADAGTADASNEGAAVEAATEAGSDDGGTE